MISKNDDKGPEEKEESRRGFIPPPTKDACPKGHIDWETVQDPTGRLIKRCRLCGSLDKSYVGKVII
jgi:hypothetical protein